MRRRYELAATNMMYEQHALLFTLRYMFICCYKQYTHMSTSVIEANVVRAHIEMTPRLFDVRLYGRCEPARQSAISVPRHVRATPPALISRQFAIRYVSFVCRPPLFFPHYDFALLL